MYKKCYESLVKKFLSLPDEPAVIVLINRSKGGQLISDCLTYYFRQAMKSENSSASYTIPNKSVYGSEYSTCVNASKSDLKNFISGSFAEEKRLRLTSLRLYFPEIRCKFTHDLYYGRKGTYNSIQGKQFGNGKSFGYKKSNFRSYKGQFKLMILFFEK